MGRHDQLHILGWWCWIWSSLWHPSMMNWLWQVLGGCRAIAYDMANGSWWVLRFVAAVRCDGHWKIKEMHNASEEQRLVRGGSVMMKSDGVNHYVEACDTHLWQSSKEMFGSISISKPSALVVRSFWSSTTRSGLECMSSRSSVDGLFFGKTIVYTHISKEKAAVGRLHGRCSNQ